MASLAHKQRTADAGSVQERWFPNADVGPYFGRTKLALQNACDVQQ